MPAQAADALDVAGRELHDACLAVAHAARDVADSSEPLVGGTTCRVDREAMDDLKAAIARWTAASRGALAAIHESRGGGA